MRLGHFGGLESAWTQQLLENARTRRGHLPTRYCRHSVFSIADRGSRATGARHAESTMIGPVSVPRRLALLLSVFLVWVGYIPTLAAQVGLLKEDAERAKLRGLTATTVRQLTEYGRPTLSELIQSRSVVVLRPTGLNVVTTVTSTTIRTWHVFVIDESLSDRPPRQSTSFYCRGQRLTPSSWVKAKLPFRSKAGLRKLTGSVSPLPISGHSNRH